MADIQCPHCGMFIPVSGKGAKTTVIIPGRAKTKLKPDKGGKVGLKGLLGEHWDDYWELAKIFGPNKNYSPSQSAKLYLEAMGQAPHSKILQQAKRIAASTEQRYLPQFAKWLEGQAYLAPYQEEPNEPTNRLHARMRAE